MTDTNKPTTPPQATTPSTPTAGSASKSNATARPATHASSAVPTPRAVKMRKVHKHSGVVEFITTTEDKMNEITGDADYTYEVV